MAMIKISGDEGFAANVEFEALAADIGVEKAREIASLTDKDLEDIEIPEITEEEYEEELKNWE